MDDKDDLTNREPHKRIIEMLTVCEEEPLTPKFVDDDGVDGFSKEQVEEALQELIDADLIVERTNPRTGDDLIGWREYVEKSDEEYDSLKTSVFQRAEAHGLSPKWRRGDGWRLVDESGKTVAVGNIRELGEYLDAAA
jgi:hypothetical protein